MASPKPMPLRVRVEAVAPDPKRVADLLRWLLERAAKREDKAA